MHFTQLTLNRVKSTVTLRNLIDQSDGGVVIHRVSSKVSVHVVSELKSRQRRDQRQTRVLAITIFGCVLLGLIVFYFVDPGAYFTNFDYAPEEGDVLFQSLPHSRLVNAIEGVTDSPYSHCGIVSKRDGQWVVYEAIQDVRATPLREFLARGRNQGFAAYRLKPKFRKHIPDTIKHVRGLLGRPYDVRYRMDDEYIYCSELVYKGYQKASGEGLGKLVRLGDMNWRPYQSTIEFYENGPVPHDREMITPKDLAKARQLKLVQSHNLAIANPK